VDGESARDPRGAVRRGRRTGRVGRLIVAPVLVAETDNGPAELGPTLSIFDPVHIGIDEFGQPKRVPLIERNMLIGGDPGSGKSGLLNAVVAHAALSLDCRLVLFDGKRVELGQWRKCADRFVGARLPAALALLWRGG